jgi:hypothetical protein
VPASQFSFDRYRVRQAVRLHTLAPRSFRLTMAKYFRDRGRQDVLLLVDNILLLHSARMAINVLQPVKCEPR